MNPRDLPSQLCDLVTELRSEAERCARDGARVDGKAVFGRVATEIEAAWREFQLEPIRIDQAAAQSGYNEETLRRLVREGVIPNAGRLNAPRIRRADLPLKPGHGADGHAIRPRVDSTTKTATLNGGRPRSDNEYDPDEDARDIAKLLEAKS